MRLILAAAALVSLTTSSLAMTDREIANDAISSALEEIDDMTPSQLEWQAMSHVQYERRVQSITQRIEGLRDFLSDNGYVRVSGFSLGVPLGASISFEFVD